MEELICVATGLKVKANKGSVEMLLKSGFERPKTQTPKKKSTTKE